MLIYVSTFRFCDSPTSDLDARLPKGRAKRGRGATNDLSNFTETRSSVHSKLRSSSNGSNKGARKGLSNSPTPFVSPRPDASSSKRKSRPSEEESASPQANGKKSKSSSQTTPPSPPSSPVFFECPEANCCKKYKHMNGLKYHQSHAHGGLCTGDDDDVNKESGSMSENEEMPSPADQQSVKSERKDENSESEPATPVSEPVPVSLNLPGSPHTQPVAAVNLLPEMEPVPVVEPSPPPVDNKIVMKPSVVRFGVPPGVDDVNVAQLTSSVGTKSPTTTTVTGVTGTRPVTSVVSTLPNTLPLTLTSTVVSQPHCLTSPSPPSISQQIPLSPSQTTTATVLPHSFPASTQSIQQTSSVQSLPLNPTPATKLPQFKVKPASVLLQDDKAKDKSKCQVQKKKSRKSPGGSPHSYPMEQSQYKIENAGREEVRSPAYSDISDDGAPVLEAEISDPKNKPLPMDKKTLESSGAHSPHAVQHFNMYPFYGQPPFLVPSVQPESKSKEDKSQENKLSDKEKKESDIPQKLLPTHFYPYDYVSNFNYNLSQNYPIAMVSSNSEKEIKEESKSPGPTDLVKQPSSSVHSSQSVGQYQSNLTKSKVDSSIKMGNDPYGNIKDSAEARSPLNASSYLHARQQQQQQQAQQQQVQQQQQQQQVQQQQQQQLQQIQQMQQIQSQSQQSSLHHAQQIQHQQMQQHQIQQQILQQQHLQQAQHQLSQSHQQQQQQEEIRRYYSGIYPDQRRKEQHPSHSEAPLKATPPPNSVSSKSTVSISGSKHKDKQILDEKKDEKVKQEGVKPTMETQGPPPPPTSSYAYFHPPSYLQSPYVPFDPAHPVYRTMNSMIVPTGPYGNSPYLHHPPQMHAQIPRYHAPEDLSRPPSGSATKALDLLHHQASQYYPSSHKIHELQERAIKSPTPKVSTTIASPSSAANGQPSSLSTPQLTPTSTSDKFSSSGSSQSTKASSVDGKDSRSPPPQRHVHTHHHTHVGLGYPILGPQYAAPYGGM